MLIPIIIYRFVLFLLDDIYDESPTIGCLLLFIVGLGILFLGVLISLFVCSGVMETLGNWMEKILPTPIQGKTRYERKGDAYTHLIVVVALIVTFIALPVVAFFVLYVGGSIVAGYLFYGVYLAIKCAFGKNTFIISEHEKWRDGFNGKEFLLQYYRYAGMLWLIGSIIAFLILKKGLLGFSYGTSISFIPAVLTFFIFFYLSKQKFRYK